MLPYFCNVNLRAKPTTIKTDIFALDLRRIHCFAFVPLTLLLLNGFSLLFRSYVCSHLSVSYFFFNMFESKLAKSLILKKVLDSIKDLVSEASWECTESGMSLQAMDTSHVSLVTVNLNSDGFRKFRCDRNMMLGMNLVNLAKILKCSSNDDKLTLQAGYSDDSDKIKLIFEAPSKLSLINHNFPQLDFKLIFFL